MRGALFPLLGAVLAIGIVLGLLLAQLVTSPALPAGGAILLDAQQARAQVEDPDIPPGEQGHAVPAPDIAPAPIGPGPARDGRADGEGNDDLDDDTDDDDRDDRTDTASDGGAAGG